MQADLSTSFSSEDVAWLRKWAQMQAHISERRLTRMRELLGDLDATDRVLEVLRSMSASTQRDLDAWTFSIRNPFRHGTVRAFIWEVLDLSPNPWLTTAEVHEQVCQLIGRHVSLNTITTALSIMKCMPAQSVIRDGRRVTLRSRATEIYI